jgi:hypothetical protein
MDPLTILRNQALVLQRGKAQVLHENVIQTLVARHMIEYCQACDAYHPEPRVTWEQIEKENTL